MTMTWRERIQAARERGKFTSEDRALAASFCTCAVAEQRANGMTFRVDSEMWPIPVDDSLANNGYYFSRRAVDRDDFDLADRLLDAIEDRALALKREFRDQDGVSTPAGRHP